MSLSESWVEVMGEVGVVHSPGIASPVYSDHHGPICGPHVNQQMERLLWEAQKESNKSSRVPSINFDESNSVSPVSPCSHLYDAESINSAVEALLLNKEDLLKRSREVNSEWIWDWTSRPEYFSKEWKLSQPLKRSKLSLRQWAVRRGIFSKEVLSVLVLSNILSLILGAGIGYSVLVRKAP